MDYPFDPTELERVLPRMPETGVVVVVRSDRKALSRYRRLTSLVHYWLVRLLSLRASVPEVAPRG